LVLSDLSELEGVARTGPAVGRRSLANSEFRFSLALPHAIGSMLQLVEVQSK
jgi:hypothetical protein